MSDEWRRVRLGDACEAITKGTTPTSVGFAFTDTGVRFVKVESMTDGRVDHNRCGYIAHATHDALARSQLKAGDVLFSIAGTLGRTAIVSDADVPANTNQAVAIVRPRSVLDSAFLRFVLSNLATRAARENGRGVGLQNINLGQLADIEVPIPPLVDQRRIVTKLAALRARSRSAREALDAVPALLDRLRQSILSAAFRGDLTADWRAKNPDVEPATELLKRIGIERRRRWEESELAKMTAKGKPPNDDRWKQKYVEPEPVDDRDLPDLPNTWCWASVEELAVIESGQTPADIEARAHSDGEVPWFRVGDMNSAGNEHELRHASVRLPAAAAAAMGLHVRPAGTIVFPKRGGAIATNKKRVLSQPSAYDLNVMGLVPSATVAQHLWCWLQSIDLASLNTGSAIPQINHGDVAPLCVPIAPHAESVALTDCVQSALRIIDRLGGQLTDEISKLGVLDAAVLASAFRGELVAR